MNKDTANASPVTQGTPELKVHKSFCYDKGGIRSIYRGGNAWTPEDDQEFLNRIFAAEDVDVQDARRVAAIHPVVAPFTKLGKDYAMVIEGMCEGVSYKELFKNAGYLNWGAFRTLTYFACDGLKKIFEQAERLRHENKLMEAEEALKTRAITGVEEKVYTQSGKLAGTRTKYSDKLLEVMLKAENPEKYSEKHQHEVRGMVVSVNLGLRDPEDPPEEEEIEDLAEAEVTEEQTL